ncbi:hypothetical protein C8T65DRAFT_648949 [Cerioporus squamosus]|nr:hypothetical protein C8T65DRAFT_648949 [Cerioporus squamosus]
MSSSLRLQVLPRFTSLTLACMAILFERSIVIIPADQVPTNGLRWPMVIYRMDSQLDRTRNHETPKSPWTLGRGSKTREHRCNLLMQGSVDKFSTAGKDHGVVRPAG